MNKQIAEHEAMKWSEIERGRVEEQEHTQEMQFLKKRTNRLKVSCFIIVYKRKHSGREACSIAVFMSSQ